MKRHAGDIRGAAGAVGLKEMWLNETHPDYGMRQFAFQCHSLSVNAGWWSGSLQGDISPNEAAVKLCLVHSEISEAMEGVRKSLMDEHLPHRKSIEVELADALIRIFDLAERMALDVTGAAIEKLEYNQRRADHTLTARASTHGKKF